MLFIKTAYRKYFEAATTPMLDFLHENTSLQIEGKESLLQWLPASDSLLSGSDWRTPRHSRDGSPQQSQNIEH